MGPGFKSVWCTFKCIWKWELRKSAHLILMAQMTKQKKTELTEYFYLVWTKNPQC